MKIFWSTIAGVLTLSGCEGAEEAGVPNESSEESVAHIVTGWRCTEYWGSPEVLRLTARPCPETREKGELCSVCRDGEPFLTAVSGVTKLSYFEYSWEPVSDQMAGCDVSPLDGDFCVVGLGGTFERVSEEVEAPTGLTRETPLPGTPRSDLGPYQFSVGTYSSEDGRMTRCNNVYGKVPDNALEAYPRSPCPDDNRCPNGCAIPSENTFGSFTDEPITYPASEEQCSSELSPESCAAAGWIVLEY